MFTCSRGERIDMSDIDGQIKKAILYLQKKEKEATQNEKKFVTVACAEIERQAKTLMRDMV